jgi:hypothetical protein
MTIQITLDDAEINAALNNLVRHINNLQPAMDSIGEALVGLIQEQLGRGETPWGDPFEPLSAAYIDAGNTPTGVGKTATDFGIEWVG